MLSSAAPPSAPRAPAAPSPLQTAVGQMPVSAQDASAATTGPTEYRSKAPPLEAHKTGQLEKEEQSGLRARHKAAEEADRRVWATDAQLLDAKQKTDFYRTKMQEIVSGDGRGGGGAERGAEEAVTSDRVHVVRTVSLFATSRVRAASVGGRNECCAMSILIILCSFGSVSRKGNVEVGKKEGGETVTT